MREPVSTPWRLAIPGDENEEILVSVFLRGGIDGLNLVPVIGGSDRGLLRNGQAATGRAPERNQRGVALDRAARIPPWPPIAGRDGGPMYRRRHFTSSTRTGKVAVVVAAGMHEENRSHFDSMGFMELGTPGTLTTSTGWLTRHLLSASNLPGEIIMPSLAVGNLQQNSLRGSTETVNMSDPDSFSLSVGPWEWRQRPAHGFAQSLLGLELAASDGFGHPRCRGHHRAQRWEWRLHTGQRCDLSLR